MTIWPLLIILEVWCLMTASYPNYICEGLLAFGPWLLCLPRFQFIYIALWIPPIALSSNYFLMFAFVFYIFLCNLIRSFDLLCSDLLAKNCFSQMLFIHLNCLLLIIIPPSWVYFWQMDLNRSSSLFLHSSHLLSFPLRF